MKRWHTPFAVLVVCLLTFGPIGYLAMQHYGKAAHANNTFTPIDLGATFTPVGISDSGIVAGNINDNSANTHPAIWQAGSFTNLTSPSDVYGTVASGVSPSGEVVGAGSYTTISSANGHALKWSGGRPSIDLNGAPNTSNNCYVENSVSWTTYASAANDVGDIAGTCDEGASDTFMAGYWPGGQPDTFTPLLDISNGVSKYQAVGINHNGDIVGWAGVYCPGATCLGQYEAAHAAFWKNGTATDINPAGGNISYANAINDNDLAVGYVEFTNDSANSHPYIWDLANNHTYDLYTSMGIDGNLTAVNDSGLVIGYGYYESSPNVPLVFMLKIGDASLTDLNSLLPANSGWVLETAVGINSSGQIVGQGQLNGQEHAFLLNPSTSSSNQLSLAPASQTATIGGGQGLVSATLLDSATNTPAPNVKLSFRVEAGPNAEMSGTCFPSSCTTDANGQVDWGYLGKAIGVDTVQVWLDTNGNGNPDTGESQTTATVTWIRSAQAQAYVALGDSYSSGEGAPNPNFLPGTDDHRIPNLCHRSTAAYPWLTHKATSNTYPTFVFRACSGAKITDFSRANQHNKGEPAQLSWLNSYAGLVTLSVGGNDVGFADVMQYCATRLLVMPSCKSKYNAEVNALIKQIGSTQTTSSSTPTTLLSLYEAIGTAAPNAKVLVVGYPRLFPTNPPLLCKTGIVLPVVGPTYFTRSDMQWLNQEGQNLDNAIKTAVDNVNKVEHSNRFVYVSNYDAFNSHELCTSHPYVNRTLIDTSYDPLKLKIWSFHPNRSGQAALATIVEAYAKQ